MPTHARITFSEPGAPPEPQRTGITVGISSPWHATPLHFAASAGLMGQEALEPRFIEIAAHHAVPRLIRAEIDVAVIDLATFLGERVLGWEGLAIAALGPLATDRSVGVAIVEESTWEQRWDSCERLVRACVRGLALATADPGRVEPALRRSGAATAEEAAAAALAGWWPDCRPTAREMSSIARWSEGSTPPALRKGLTWARRAD